MRLASSWMRGGSGWMGVGSNRVRLGSGWMRLSSGWIGLASGWIRLSSGWMRLAFNGVPRQSGLIRPSYHWGSARFYLTGAGVSACIAGAPAAKSHSASAALALQLLCSHAALLQARMPAIPTSCFVVMPRFCRQDARSPHKLEACATYTTKVVYGLATALLFPMPTANAPAHEGTGGFARIQ
jgi:hypothetical protein